MTEPESREETESKAVAPGSGASPPSAWFDLAVPIWLLIVTLGYGFLTAADMNVRPRELLKELPTITELDRLILPFLVLVVCAGIIRYYCVRAQERAASTALTASDSRRRDIA